MVDQFLLELEKLFDHAYPGFNNDKARSFNIKTHFSAGLLSYLKEKLQALHGTPETLEDAVKQAKNIEVSINDAPHVVILQVSHSNGQNQSKKSKNKNKMEADQQVGAVARNLNSDSLSVEGLCERIQQLQDKIESRQGDQVNAMQHDFHDSQQQWCDNNEHPQGFSYSGQG